MLFYYVATDGGTLPSAKTVLEREIPGETSLPGYVVIGVTGAFPESTTLLQSGDFASYAMIMNNPVNHIS